MAAHGRRTFMLAAGAAVFVAGWQRYMVRPPVLDFEPIEAAPGWQFAMAGEVSGLSGTDLITLGLETTHPPLPVERLEAVVHRDHAGGAAVAVFSDFFCPYCRELIGRLDRMASEGPALSVSWHELPLLGPSSELAARAAEAAALQGGYVRFQRQLLQDGFRPLPAWMGEVGARAGLDGEALVREMEGPRVADRLADTAGAAARLGIFATPGLVIGRKVVMGAVGRDVLSQLMADAKT